MGNSSWVAGRSATRADQIARGFFFTTPVLVAHLPVAHLAVAAIPFDELSCVIGYSPTHRSTETSALTLFA